jgi:hypothetical protein
MPGACERQKAAWEFDVARLNTTAILDASRAKSDAWLYFNHRRPFELAASFKIKFKYLGRYDAAYATNLLSSDGMLHPRSKSLTYVHNDGDGLPLYFYVREVMHAVLEHLTVFNISDHLDRGVLLPVVKSDDFSLIQGPHNFRRIDRRDSGPGQTSAGKRCANHVEVRFTFDRWEATSNSAFSLWLRGRQCVANLLRVGGVEHADGQLRLTGTVIGIALVIENLKLRDYSPAKRIRKVRTISI